MLTVEVKEVRQYDVTTLLNDYVVKYAGKKMSLSDYLVTKDNESIKDFNKSKKYGSEIGTALQNDVIGDYTVKYQGKSISLDEYLTMKEQECYNCGK